MRTLIASVLVAAALATALIGWFGAGWSAVAQRQAELLAEPRRAAEGRARELAAEVVARLEQLRVSEARRPYYHYQSLFHDPRGAAEGFAVAPSPLAAGPGDPLVLGHFQVRAKGAGWDVTLPTINDDIPELTNVGNLASDNRLRADLIAAAAGLTAAAGPPVALPTVATADSVEPKRPPIQVAQAEVPGVRPTANPPPVADTHPPGVDDPAAASETQVIELSPDQYNQNAYPNYVFQQALENQHVIDWSALHPDAEHPGKKPAPAPQTAPAPRKPVHDELPPLPPDLEPAATANPPAPVPPAPAVAPPKRARARVGAPKPPAVVTIAVAPLEWHAAMLGERSALVALRRVDTPDGALTQGLVIDDEAVASWVAQRMPGARLVPVVASAEATATKEPATPSAMVSADVPFHPRSWRVDIQVDGMAAAESAAAAVRSAFWGRFVPVAAIATLCGLLVIVVVARAERFGNARSRFAAAAAHELRTPLAGLQLYGDMLADGLGDPGKAQQYAHRIAEEASRLGRVVANVLGFSQLERGDLAVHPRPGDAAAAARDVVDRVRPALERAGMTLAVELPAELPARLDPDAVARILGNLIDNAEKYSRGGDDRRVSVTGRARDDVIELAVTDSGPGVAAGARLFVPFSRGVGGDGPAGLGLGLALSRSLARAMDGELAHTGGATFVLTLPAAPSAGDPAHARP